MLSFTLNEKYNIFLIIICKNAIETVYVNILFLMSVVNKGKDEVLEKNTGICVCVYINSRAQTTVHLTTTFVFLIIKIKTL